MISLVCNVHLILPDPLIMKLKNYITATSRMPIRGASRSGLRVGPSCDLRVSGASGDGQFPGKRKDPGLSVPRTDKGTPGMTDPQISENEHEKIAPGNSRYGS